mmetsp:Transcript_95840/g.298526  ORF Transcript_95840/g.298526 Transcript_95840/m.298526 type:complete len:230 (+) Transcript_95840:120-809(+)
MRPWPWPGWRCSSASLGPSTPLASTSWAKSALAPGQGPTSLLGAGRWAKISRGSPARPRWSAASRARWLAPRSSATPPRTSSVPPRAWPSTPSAGTGCCGACPAACCCRSASCRPSRPLPLPRSWAWSGSRCLPRSWRSAASTGPTRPVASSTRPPRGSRSSSREQAHRCPARPARGLPGSSASACSSWRCSPTPSPPTTTRLCSTMSCRSPVRAKAPAAAASSRASGT